MKHIPIWAFLSIPKLTAGRRRLSLQRLRDELAAIPSLSHLLPAVDKAIAAQEAAIALRARRPSSLEVSRMHAARAMTLDIEVDRAVSGLHGTLTSTVRALSPDDPAAVAAEHLLASVFVGGVAPITQLPFVDQHAAVDQLLKVLREDPDAVAAVALLTLQRWVDRIEALNAEYGEHVTQESPIRGQDIRDADRAGWVAFCEVMVQVLGAVPGSEEADEVLRGRLLGPVISQRDELRKLRARRAAGGSVVQIEDEILDFDFDDAGEEAPAAEPED